MTEIDRITIGNKDRIASVPSASFSLGKWHELLRKQVLKLKCDEEQSTSDKAKMNITQ